MDLSHSLIHPNMRFIAVLPLKGFRARRAVFQAFFLVIIHFLSSVKLHSAPGSWTSYWFTANRMYKQHMPFKVTSTPATNKIIWIISHSCQSINSTLTELLPELHAKRETSKFPLSQLSLTDIFIIRCNRIVYSYDTIMCYIQYILVLTVIPTA